MPFFIQILIYKIKYFDYQNTIDKYIKILYNINSLIIKIYENQINKKKERVWV